MAGRRDAASNHCAHRQSASSENCDVRQNSAARAELLPQLLAGQLRVPPPNRLRNCRQPSCKLAEFCECRVFVGEGETIRAPGFRIWIKFGWLDKFLAD